MTKRILAIAMAAMLVILGSISALRQPNPRSPQMQSATSVFKPAATTMTVRRLTLRRDSSSVLRTAAASASLQTAAH